MLNLYLGRENIDKERFIYDHVSGETFVIVPNQYTLVAEEQALKYLGTDCLYDTEILSMNRLGLRVLTEQGKESAVMLDRYGRFMLLNRIIKSHQDELKIFSRAAGKLTFTSMVNDFISEFKQQDCSLDQLKEMLGSSDTDELLKAKIQELGAIIEEYNASIDGIYTDSEDYIAMYVDAIKDSRFLEGKNIWIYGYDSITPRFLSSMLELSRRCASCSFVVNESDYDLDNMVVRTIRNKAEEVGIAVNVEKIGSEYGLEKTKTIEAVERWLFNDNADAENYEPEDLTMVCAANPYYEAENAAVYVYHLVRDLGYKMRDIQIIANDEGTMQPIIRRTFSEYGLPVFMDQARKITDTAIVSFIVNLLKFANYKKTDELMAMLKSGFAGIDIDDAENLENYASKYHIKGSMWDRPFKYGAELEGEEKIAKLEEIRNKLSESIQKLVKIAGEGSYANFIDNFKKYLEETWDISNRVIETANLQSDMQYYEEAQRSAESYRLAMELLDQIKQIMADEPMNLTEFIDIYIAGLTNVEVGVIPPSADGLSLGTMIRTRPRAAKAVVILGANEGTLPLEPSTEGLFSVDEKNYFRGRGFALGELDDIKMSEERVAMYRMMSKPSNKLYVSYSMAGADGEDLAPSSIIDSLKELFPTVKIEKDIISEGWNEELISSGTTGMRHLINHLKDRNAASNMDELTNAALTWYEQHDKDTLNSMLAAAADENNPRGIGSKIAGSLYSRRDGNLVLSASSISNYFDCPFKFFIDKGIKPKEERKFESDPRSIGDVYHECLMVIARKIIADKNYGKQLLDCSDEELEKIISSELSAIGQTYEGGLFISSGTEEYRMERIKEICAIAVRSLAMQLAQDSVVDASFETDFGRGHKFAPLEFEVEGKKVYVEGKIDRADILGGDRVRIIDYKTGKDKFDPWKASHGYKMQLVIYMISATTNELEPAGMFYFNIEDPMQSLNDKTEVKDDGFKLRGRYIDEPGVLESMPQEVLAGTRDISLSREEYNVLKDDVVNNIEKIASGIASGKIDIRPLKPNKTLVCGYCQYKAICKRDREYALNSGREIPAAPKKQKEDK